MPLITAVKCDKCGASKTYRGHIAKQTFFKVLRDEGWCVSNEKKRGVEEEVYCPDCREWRLSQMGMENLKWNEREKYHD